MIQKCIIQQKTVTFYKLQAWSDMSNLYFDVLKCKVMHTGKKNHEKKLFNDIRKADILTLEASPTEKDLGLEVTFDNNLKFYIHLILECIRWLK